MHEKQLNFKESRSSVSKLLEDIKLNRHPISLLLDRLTNVRNIGALFRLADAARLTAIYAYQMESIEESAKLKRIARSTLDYVPYYSLNHLEEIKQISHSSQLVALEITNQSLPFHQYQTKQPITLIIGNEQRGVSTELLELSEASIHIPMLGINTSMNVSVATGIAVYRLLEMQGKI